MFFKILDEAPQNEIPRGAVQTALEDGIGLRGVALGALWLFGEMLTCTGQSQPPADDPYRTPEPWEISHSSWFVHYE